MSSDSVDPWLFERSRNRSNSFRDRNMAAAAAEPPANTTSHTATAAVLSPSLRVSSSVSVSPALSSTRPLAIDPPRKSEFLPLLPPKQRASLAPIALSPASVDPHPAAPPSEADPETSDLRTENLDIGRLALRSASIAAKLPMENEIDGDAESADRPSSAAPVSAARSDSSKAISQPFQSPLQVFLVQYRQRTQFRRTFVEYRIDVRSGPLSWTVFKRFSEFAELEEQLEKFYRGQKAVLTRLPKLPHRVRLLANKEEFLTQRKRELQEYLLMLLLDPELALSVPLLVFLGVMSRDIHSKPKNFEGLSKTVHIDAAMELFREGDIILFKTEGILQAVQRSLTKSKYDHVGIVIRSPWNSETIKSNTAMTNGMYCLEATIEGVKKYPLRRRLEAWSASNAIVVLRQLKANRTPEWKEKLGKFVEEVEGLPYSVGPLKFLQANASDANSSSYFCSELVAAAYKRVGLLPQESAAVKYLPASFSEAHQLTLAQPDAVLEKEILLSFSRPEISMAVHSPISTPPRRASPERKEPGKEQRPSASLPGTKGMLHDRYHPPAVPEKKKDNNRNSTAQVQPFSFSHAKLSIARESEFSLMEPGLASGMDGNPFSPSRQAALGGRGSVAPFQYPMSNAAEPHSPSLTDNAGEIDGDGSPPIIDEDEEWESQFVSRGRANAAESTNMLTR